jgi:hypothetical protein
MDLALGQEPKAMRRALNTLFVASVVVAAALPLGHVMSKLPVDRLDYIMVAVGVVASLAALISLHRDRSMQSLVVYASGLSFMFAIAFGPWGRTFKGSPEREVGREVIGTHGNRPYLLFDDRVDLPLVFAMRRPIECSESDHVVGEWMRRHPDGVVLLRGKENPHTARLPSWLEPDQRIGVGDTAVWTLKRSSP